MNQKVDQMTSFIVMDILEKANAMQQQGIDIIHMEVGEPDFDVPPSVAQAAQQACVEHKTHYTHSLGSPILRREIAQLYQREYGVSVDPDCIVVTSGSSPAILMLTLLLCNPGDEIILSNPGYACYKNFVLAAGATPVAVPLKPENGFRYDIDDIRGYITPRTRGIFINSPMNPTGALLSPAFFQQLAQLGIPIISDEIYHGLVYEGEAHTVLEYTSQAFVLNGFSKRFAMTGLRLGYLIAPQAYMPALQKMQQNFSICAPSISQEAGIAALRHAHQDVAAMRATYDERRRYMLSRLQAMHLPPIVEPQGAFYILADARQYTRDSYHFAFDILEKAHVGVTPGIDFGTEAEGFIRLSYANSLQNLKEGLDRLERYIATL